MALVGLVDSFLTLNDADTNALITGDNGLSTTGVLEIGDKYFGTSEANISNFEGSLQTMSGNDKGQFSYQQPSQPAVAYTVNNLDFEIKQKLLGYKKDGLGWIKSDVKPTVGLVVVTRSLDKQHKIYYAFPKGNMTLTSLALKSDTPTSTTPITDALNFTSLSADSIGGRNVKTYIDGDATFTQDAMFKELFPDYKAASGATTPSNG
ncbi:phage tail protein [Liquorilactobacillus uvarum]|uniref:phage tail protein n=1 Tax=Liquorilactobacillus uvarum TaxID=303240 RepID=UPI00288941DD|nr:phage tail protein [Liquorilactobacillus uvarum]